MARDMAKGMTTKRSIIFFWALFLVPTLIMAGAAARLLIHEQERINRSSLSVLTQRAEAITETIHLTIETVHHNLTQSLMEIGSYDSQKLKQRLLKWEATNPLVRNVFIFKEKKKLSYPVKGMASTLEERRFMNRYDAFFSGRMPLETDAHVLENGPSEHRTSYGRIEEKKTESSRKQLEALSRVAKLSPAQYELDESEQSSATLSSVPSSNQSFEPQSGWLPWFSENQLYILIWVKPLAKHAVYGLELELMTLLSRLIVDFPPIEDAAAALVLTDGKNNYIHQSGSLILTEEMKPVATVSVSSLLPHWQIGVFVDKKGHGSTNAFLYLSLILLGIFIVAIVSGGALMTRMTLKNIKDARQKTSFVSSVSHELKTPLTSIRMYAELLLAGRVKDAVKKEKYLSVIVGESERLTRLINNVLDFGRLEQGKKKYRITSVDVNDLLYQLIDAHKIRIEQQDLEIIIHAAEDDFKIKTDRDAIKQVMLNLLDNALKYAGGGKFIRFSLQKEDETILFKICDDGPGIPRSQVTMIFEKFHRIDNSLTAAQPGSGLGLSIARRILRDLGGDLYFEPYFKPHLKSGTGSCFTARIKNHDAN